MSCEPAGVTGRPCDLPRLRLERVVRHEASGIEWSERSNGGPSQRVVEAGGSLALEARGAGASGPDNDGTGRYCQTARGPASETGRCSESEPVAEPLKRGTGSNLADVGRDAAARRGGGARACEAAAGGKPRAGED